MTPFSHDYSEKERPMSVADTEAILVRAGLITNPPSSPSNPLALVSPIQQDRKPVVYTVGLSNRSEPCGK